MEPRKVVNLKKGQAKSKAKGKAKAEAKGKKDSRSDSDNRDAVPAQKKPAAKGMKRPASATPRSQEPKPLRATKCMYGNGSWGIKCHGSQQCSV